MQILFIIKRHTNIHLKVLVPVPVQLLMLMLLRKLMLKNLKNHISAPTLSFSNISINETKFNVFPVPGDGNCFFHSLSLILNGDFSMSNNYRQLICTFILQNWAFWEDRILISHEHNMTNLCIQM